MNTEVPRNVVTSPSTSNSNIVEDELIALLARQSQRVPLPIIILSLLIAFLASDYVNMAILVTWVTILISLVFIRRGILGTLPKRHDLSHETRIKIAAVLSTANGITHGASSFFFPENAAFEHSMQTMLLLGLSAGAVGTTTGHKTIFLAYIIPAIIPNALTWLYFGIVSNPVSIVYISVSILVTMFAGILIALGRDSYNSFKESIEIRSQQAETNKQLEHALLEAESANNAKTRFLASASHDLRQPIHTLSLLGASLSMRPLDERSKQISTHINTALDSLATQLDSLLDISKLDAGIVETNKTTSDLSALCHRLHSEFATPAANKGIHLESEIEHDSIVYTDITLLERILRNLISNAIKYTHQGTVKIELKRKDPSNYEIAIIDSGTGISEEDQKYIFEEFYQVDNPERDRNKGLGLGLAIVKRLLTLLDLKIQIDSTVGRGTQFSIAIESAIYHNNDKNESNKYHLDWSRYRILVIDDEAMVRFAVDTLLTQLGATVYTTDSQEDALQSAKENTPNLVLADFRLRGNESGLDAIESIRSFIPQLPAILISGDTGPERLQQAKRAGVPFLHKPVRVQELEEAVLAFSIRDDNKNGASNKQTKPEKHKLNRL